jgi:hypothetical protein
MSDKPKKPKQIKALKVTKSSKIVKDILSEDMQMEDNSKQISAENKQIKDGLTHTHSTQFPAGKSGNPNGRPKTKISEGDRESFGTDAKAALEWALANASSKAEMIEIAKLLLPYQTPKIANTSSDDKEFKLNILSDWIPQQVIDEQ